MSAIAKPFVHFTGATAAGQKLYVPVEHVQSAEALDVAALPNSTPAEYLILITSVYPGGATKEVKVPFPNATDRNTALTNFKAAMSTAVAS